MDIPVQMYNAVRGSGDPFHLRPTPMGPSSTHIEARSGTTGLGAILSAEMPMPR